MCEFTVNKYSCNHTDPTILIRQCTYAANISDIRESFHNGMIMSDLDIQWRGASRRTKLNAKLRRQRLRSNKKRNATLALRGRIERKSALRGKEEMTLGWDIRRMSGMRLGDYVRITASHKR
jgi:hypothetical protein